MVEDTSKIKERIISILNIKGPNFPSPIASEIQTSILFTSAFLSELLSEKRIKITNMKVGSSPVYYLEGQENQLEPLATKYLKSKEKDAFLLLKEKKVLKDKEQNPAIRVALREIKDFAIPEEKNSELYWVYFITQKEEIKIPEKTEEIKMETKPEPEKPLEIFDKKPEEKEPEAEVEKETPKPKKKIIKKIAKKKTSSKTNEKFFNKVKESLIENNIEILDIIGFSKKDLMLKIKENNQEYLLVSYNKKTLKEEDILNAFKKALELNLEYQIMLFGEPSKKISNIIEASKKLKEIKRIKN